MITPTQFVMAKATGGTVRVNRALDWADRTFWTFMETFLAQLTIDGLTSFNSSTVHQLEIAVVAALYTTFKTLAAQRTGNSPLGDAIPGDGVVTGPTVPA